MLTVFNFSFADKAPDIQLVARSVFEPRQLAVCGAGGAVPDAAGGIMINPATSLDWFLAEGHAVQPGIAYGRSGLFQSNQISTTTGFMSGENTAIIARYAFLDNGNGNHANCITTTFSGLLGGEKLNAGSIFSGLSIHYVSSVWKNPNDPLNDTSTGDTLYKATFNPSSSTTKMTENRFTCDLGLFQTDFAQGFNFGIVCTDLIGYSFGRNPYGQNLDTISTHKDSATSTNIIHIRRDSVFETGDKKFSGIIKSDRTDRALTLSASWNHDFKKVHVTVPFDFSFLDLFDGQKSWTQGIRCGAEMMIADLVCLRGGWSRTPQKLIDGRDGDLVNRFSGGGGIYIPKGCIDFAIVSDGFSVALRGFFGGTKAAEEKNQ